jgi:hypothetical protein
MSKSSIVSGMGVAMSLITSLMSFIKEVGGDEEAIHRLVTPEGEETLRKMARIAIEDAKAGEKIPKDGDRAYTRYHDQKYVGILRIGTSHMGWLVPEESMVDWGYHGYRQARMAFVEGRSRMTVIAIDNLRGLRVGSDEAIRWDPADNMWFAPADSD